MRKEITADDIYDQIDKEAKAIAKKVARYDPDTDEELGQYKPKQIAYENIVKWYKAGAIPYGERLANAEDLIKKMAQALAGILNTNHDNHEKAILKVKAISTATLMDYNAYVDALTNKTSDDDKVNG